MTNNNVTNKDLQLFSILYNNSRAQNILLYSIDFDSIKVNVQKIHNHSYPKLKQLWLFLSSWQFEEFGPLYGRDLIANGFNDLQTIFNEIGNRVSDLNYQSLNQYVLKDNDIINIPLLATIVIHAEICRSILPYLKENTRYIYVKENQENQTTFEKGLNEYLYFLKYGKELESTNQNISIHVSDYEYKEFFPDTIICIDRLPFILFQQSDRATAYGDLRNQPIYRISTTYSSIEPYKLRDYRDSSNATKNFKSMQEVMETVFSLPTDFENNKNQILTEINYIFKLNADKIQVLYDWVRDCYYLDSDTEDLLYSDICITLSTKPEFCKYTSLKTLLATLQSKKIRMNSIVSMNDPTETEKMKNEGCNFLFYKETEDSVKKNSNYYFITSLTTKKDDLDMWRFYGDDATGVCLVFEPFGDNSNANDDINKVYDINYVNFGSEIFSHIDTLLSNLENKNIRFCIMSYVFRYLLMKPEDFRTEDEKRLIVQTLQPNGFTTYSNNIVTPYIEKKIPTTSQEAASENFFPLRLTEIILGPEMPNKDINKRQIEFMISELNDFLKNDYKGIHVKTSRISCYRN